MIKINILSLNRDNVAESVGILANAISLADRKISYNRACELASACLRWRIGNNLASIEAKTHPTDDEVTFYDSVYVEDWNYARDLEAASGTRTMITDYDHPIVQEFLSR